MNILIVCLGPNIGSQWEPSHYYSTIRDLKMNLHGIHCESAGMGRTQIAIYIYIYACKGNKYPGIPTTIKTMDVNITTIDYLRVLIIKIGSTIILMVVENLFVPCSGYVVFLLPASPEGKVKGCHETQETSSSQIGFGSRREKHQNLPKTVLFQQQNPTTS